MGLGIDLKRLKETYSTKLSLDSSVNADTDTTLEQHGALPSRSESDILGGRGATHRIY
jgi:hypothetical protein